MKTTDTKDWNGNKRSAFSQIGASSAPKTETSRRCVRMVALPLHTHGMCLRRDTLATQSSNGFKTDMT